MSYLIVFIFLIIGIWLLYNRTIPTIIIEQGQLQLLTGVDCGVYETTSELNVLLCDISTVSYIVQEMQEDSYYLECVVADTESMDVFLSKEADIYRLHYTKDGTLMSICNKYEKSFVPFTYINEE